MNEALGLSMAASGAAAGMFFWGYLVLQLPGGHLAEHGKAKHFILWTILGWGGVSLMTAFVQNAWQLYLMRFLLGVAESGVYPAILVIIGNWFPQRELGRAQGLFITSLPLSAAVTNPISGFIVAHYGWRGLFLFEGAVSLVMILIWLPLISESPSDAKWISKEEKEYLITTLAAEKAQREATFQARGREKWSYGTLLKDKYLWIMIIFYVFHTAGTYGYLFWLPTMLKRMTKMSMSSVGWLSAPPLVAAVAGVYVFGALSDKTGNRRGYCALGFCGFGTSFFLATLFPNHIWLAYLALAVTGFFSKAMQSPCWAMPALIFPPGVAGGARGIVLGIGNLGGFLGPWLVGLLSSKTGSMTVGIDSLAVALLLGAAVTMLMPRVTAGYKYHKELAQKTRVL
jgi:MFS family permease